MTHTQKRIFVIDDDPNIIEFLSYNLKKEGYEVVSAASGLQGIWEISDDHLPDLVLLDLMMPSPDGYELCQFLKTSDTFRQIPVIIISAKGSEQDIKQGLEIGAEAYLSKPFSINSLLNLVQQLTA